jgi:uncharacterized protein (TIGR02145 family)
MSRANKYLFFLVISGLCFLLAGCTKRTVEHLVTIPSVTTQDVSNIGATTAISGGTISDDGGSAITARGVCWSSTSQMPVVSGDKTIDGNGAGGYVSSLTKLLPNTPYYIRAYATNSQGTAYGDVKMFATVVANSRLATYEVSNITAGSAWSGGTVQDNGGSPVTARGVCWSSSNPQPTAEDHKTSDGTGSGSFFSLLTGLISNTLYHVRSYAITSTGTSYGNAVIFTTLRLPVVITNGCSNVVMNTADLAGKVNDDGGAPVTRRGFCWSSSTAEPTTSDDTVVCSIGGGSFAISLKDLTGQTTYHLRAWATNSNGTGYGNTVSLRTIDTTITDIDNNLYRIVQIGTQIWMAENLRVEHYRNGDPVPVVSSNSQWSVISGGGMCWYSHDSAKYASYGPLYNWAAAMDQRGLSPKGWHIPSNGEWTTLITFLGGTDIAGARMKETGTAHWFEPNLGADNRSGFRGIGGGLRYTSGHYIGLNESGLYWSSSSGTSMLNLAYSWTRAKIDDYTLEKLAVSIRCIKD